MTTYPEDSRRDSVARTGYQVMERQSRRLAYAYGLSENERQDLLEVFLDRFSRRFVPQLHTMQVAGAEQIFWRYFGATRREDGRPVGAGWEAERIRARRSRHQPLCVPSADDGAEESGLADPYALDLADSIWEEERATEDAAWQETLAAARERRRGRALAALEDYCVGASASDAFVLRRRAQGKSFKEIADGDPYGRKPNSHYRQFERAWARIPTDVATVIAAACSPPDKNPKKARRRPE